MASLGTAPDQIDTLVAGKRVSPRLPVALSVRIKGALGEFLAEARDLSRGGAFLTLDLEASGGADGDLPLDAAGQFAFIDQQFHQNFDIQFLEASVVVEAQLVRLALHTNDEGSVGLGCRFVHALTHGQERALGMRGAREDRADEADWELSVGVHDARRVADPLRPISALLVDAREASIGPLFLGPVLLAGRAAVVVRLDGVDPEAARERLTTEGLRVRLLRGLTPLVDAPIECVSVRYVDYPRPGSEVLLAFSERLPRSTRRLFRSP